MTSWLKLFGDYVYLPNTNSFTGSKTENPTDIMTKGSELHQHRYLCDKLGMETPRIEGECWTKTMRNLDEGSDKEEEGGDNGEN